MRVHCDLSRTARKLRFRHDEVGSPTELQDAIAAWIEAITKAGNAIPESAATIWPQNDATLKPPNAAIAERDGTHAK
jgi:hypothetical protein